MLFASVPLGIGVVLICRIFLDQLLIPRMIPLLTWA